MVDEVEIRIPNFKCELGQNSKGEWRIEKIYAHTNNHEEAVKLAFEMKADAEQRINKEA